MSIKIKNREDSLEEDFPDLKKELSFYFDNVKKIKNDFKILEKLWMKKLRNGWILVMRYLKIIQFD